MSKLVKYSKEFKLENFKTEQPQSKFVIAKILDSQPSYEDILEKGEEWRRYLLSIGITMSTYVAFDGYFKDQVSKKLLNVNAERFQSQNNLDNLQKSKSSNQQDLGKVKDKHAKNTKLEIEINSNISESQKLINELGIQLEERLNRLLNRDITQLELKREIETIRNIKKDFDKYVDVPHQETHFYGKTIVDMQNEIARRNNRKTELREELAKVSPSKEKREVNKAEGKISKNQDKLDNQKMAAGQTKESIKQQKFKIDRLTKQIASETRAIDDLKNKVSILNEESNRLNNLRANHYSINKLNKLNKEIENFTTSPAFRSVMVALSIKPLIEVYVKSTEDRQIKDTIGVMSIHTDFISITVDLLSGLKRPLMGCVKSFRTQRIVVGLAAKAAAASMFFGIVSTIVSAVISFIDMSARLRKGDTNAAILYMANGLIGTPVVSLSCISFAATMGWMSVGLTLATIMPVFILVGLIVMFVIEIIIVFIMDDDFETFLKTSVLSGSSGCRLNRIGEEKKLSSSEVIIRLCMAPQFFGENNGIYEEKTNNKKPIDQIDIFNKRKGKERKKRNLDLTNFENMLEWIYNLMVSFSCSANLKDNNNGVFEKINMLLYFGAYDAAKSNIEIKYMVFPQGIKQYDNHPNSVYYQPQTIALNKSSLYYQERTNWKDIKIGDGIKYNLDLTSTLKVWKDADIKIDADKMEYILFFRFRLDDGTWWPYQAGGKSDPLFVALTEGLKYNKNGISIYTVYKNNPRRTPLDSEKVYLGTESNIIAYLGASTEPLK